MTISGLINGEKCNILLDSGAGYCFVDFDYITKRNLRIEENRWKDMNVFTANGGNLEVSGVIDLDVTLGKETFSHRFFVTKGLVVPLLIWNYNRTGAHVGKMPNLFAATTNWFAVDRPMASK